MQTAIVAAAIAIAVLLFAVRVRRRLRRRRAIIQHQLVARSMVSGRR
jgi:hypothetical protein